jgi:CRP-like cAMP-binding protein
MFIVISGGLDVLVDFSGRNQFAAAEVVDQVGQGAALGEIGMMTGERRTAFLKATEECHVMEVTYTAVKEVTLRRAELHEELMMIVKVGPTLLRALTQNPKSGSMNA